ncbi:unnamed protein product [Heterobilharzia americana]|nr:unnamed protein product [Heterobilharzia americana]
MIQMHGQKKFYYSVMLYIFGSHEHLARLHRHIEDDTFDLEMLSAFLNLFIVTVKLPSVKLLLSSNDETRKVERKKFLSVIQYALSNLCLATGRAWLCTACADSLVTLDVFGFLDYQEVGNLFIGRKCTDHDFSHDLLHFICDLLKSLFNLVQIPYLKAYFVNISFKLMQCLLYLSKCLVYCSSLVYPSMTSECVLYAIRIVGCLCFNEIETGSTSRSTGLTHPNKISLFNNFLSIINWYHQRRCSWSMCGIELCWSLTNFVKCFNVPMFYHQLENDEALSCFIDSFLFRLFTLEGGSREVMYLLYVSIKMTQFSSVTDNNNYFWWIRILNQLDCRLKPQLIYWKYLKQNLPRCYIETFTYLLKFLSIILVYDNRVLWKYIKENCCTLLKLFSLCDNTLRILPSLTPSSLSVEETIRVICSSNSSEDIISYILSVVEYVS